MALRQTVHCRAGLGWCLRLSPLALRALWVLFEGRYQLIDTQFCDVQTPFAAKLGCEDEKERLEVPQWLRGTDLWPVCSAGTL